MNKIINQMNSWIAAREKREQILLVLTVLAGVYFFWQYAIMDMLSAQESSIQQRIKISNDNIKKINQQIQIISNRIKQDPVLDLQKQIEKINQQKEALSKQMDKLTSELVPPKQITKLLGGILSADKNLQVIRIENLPVEAVFSQSDKEEGAPQTLQVYRHGLVMEFRGSYFQINQFLKMLEGLPHKIIWDELRYQVIEHPTANVTLTVYTLSLDKSWISI